MGVGNFFGLIPSRLSSKTNLYGVEIDSITGRIASLLYPDANITIAPYQDVAFTDGSFEAAVGNVPFLDVSYKYKGNNYMLHDYFFVKTLDKVKNGGLVLFLTSTGTLDKQNPKIRQTIADKANLIAAARLPNDAFKKNAGTSVTTDLLILQKRADDVPSNGIAFDKISNIGEIPINEYFVEHPENIFGELVSEKGMYAQERTQVKPSSDSLDVLFERFINRLPKNIIGNSAAVAVEIETSDKSGYVEKDGKYYFTEKGEAPVEITGVDKKRVGHFIDIKNAYNKLLEMYTGDYGSAQIEAQRIILKSLYDGMIADKSISYGNSENILNSLKMRRLLNVDDDYYRVSGLERYDQKTEKYVVSDILNKVISSGVKKTEVNSAHDALKLSMSSKGKVDLQYMESVTGLPVDKLLAEIQDVVYESPSGEFVIAPLYLSGNVRDKLVEAEKAAKHNGKYNRNVKALRQVMPPEINASRISPQLGAAWINPVHYKSFVSEVIGGGYITGEFAYDHITGTWVLPKFNVSRYNETKYGTSRRSVHEILESVMNQKSIKVYDTDGTSRVFNPVATEEARVKADAVREAFESWIFKEDTRRTEVVNSFNERFNYYVTPDYSSVSEYIDFTDMSPDFSPRDYQKNVVARIAFNNGTLVAHGVGTGKTAEIIIGAHQLKLTGRSKKPMFVVPTNKTGDFREEYLKIYPTANILTVTNEEAAANRRAKLLAQIASNEWDAVIMGIPHSGLSLYRKKRKKIIYNNRLMI